MKNYDGKTIIVVVLVVVVVGVLIVEKLQFLEQDLPLP